MSIAAEGHDKLDINRAIRGTVEVLHRNWRSLVRPALLLVYLPAVLTTLFRPHVGPAGDVPGAALLDLLASVLEIVLYALFLGGVFRLAVADLHAEPISTDDALKVGRQRMWAMLGLTLLTGLGVALGLVLLIVPGVLLALAWTAAGPALIEERLPILESFGRSVDLTRRSRLNIFGLGLLFLAAEILAVIPFAVAAAIFPQPLFAALLAPLYSAATAVAGGVMLAVIYDELRRIEEARQAGSPAATDEAGA